MSNTITDYLVSRYGPEILTVPERKACPRREASPGKLLVSISKPAARKKLLSELRGERIKAYGPPEGGRYTFSGAVPAFCKHAATVIGEVNRGAIGVLYPKRQKPVRQENPFKPGDKATKGDLSVNVVSVSGRTCLIAFEMIGKTHTQSIHYTQLRPG